MPVERHAISVSQFCGLLELDPKRFVAIERQGRASTLTIVLEPEEQMNTSGTFPQLTKGGKRVGTNGGKKKGSC